MKECLAHVWLAPSEEEPPSPSPLMLKIPTPDFAPEPVPKINHGRDHGHHGAGGGHHGGPSSSRRSCQTCRDKITERKRYLSKSREAIFEKVAQSNLKKSLSKSRERLCDIRLTLSKSREDFGYGTGNGNGANGENGSGSDVNKIMSRYNTVFEFSSCGERNGFWCCSIRFFLKNQDDLVIIIQVNLCQKFLFLHQLTYNVTTD